MVSRGSVVSIAGSSGASYRQYYPPTQRNLPATEMTLAPHYRCWKAKSVQLAGSYCMILMAMWGSVRQHPERVPDVRKDGSSRHFFHKPEKAYTTGELLRVHLYS
ncbi:hypothetical protein R1flu_003860 [Riccia fluitans]|uniref:Uncharacterized protein n=1 Tax=Riccia fluitans TaxID=41844 RepID=A0ABD1YAD0_9MARC